MADQIVVVDSGEVTGPAGPTPHWDIAVDSTAGDTFSCFLGTCVAGLVHGEQGAFVFAEEYSFRLYQVPGSDGLFVFAQTNPESFEAVKSLSELVVAAMSTTG